MFHCVWAFAVFRRSWGFGAFRPSWRFVAFHRVCAAVPFHDGVLQTAGEHQSVLAQRVAWWALANIAPADQPTSDRRWADRPVLTARRHLAAQCRLFACCLPACHCQCPPSVKKHWKSFAQRCAIRPHPSPGMSLILEARRLRCAQHSHLLLLAPFWKLVHRLHHRLPSSLPCSATPSWIQRHPCSWLVSRHLTEPPGSACFRSERDD